MGKQDLFVRKVKRVPAEYLYQIINATNNEPDSDDEENFRTLTLAQLLNLRAQNDTDYENIIFEDASEEDDNVEGNNEEDNDEEDDKDEKDDEEIDKDVKDDEEDDNDEKDDEEDENTEKDDEEDNETSNNHDVSSSSDEDDSTIDKNNDDNEDDNEHDDDDDDEDNNESDTDNNSQDESNNENKSETTENCNESMKKFTNALKNNAIEKRTPIIDEYDDYDTSDEEDIRNTVGNVPKKWYDEYKHLGYDWDGKQILKPESGDNLDEFLKKMEDPNFWRTVKDPQTGQNVILSDDDVNLIRRIHSQKIPDVSFDEYAPWIEWFTSKVETMPIRSFPEHKRSFLPSRSRAKLISKLKHGLKMGWIKAKEDYEKEKAKKEPQFYMLWDSDDKAEEMRRIHNHIPAPKRLLPGHAESYNPPPEYLFDAKELKEWKKNKDTPSKRKLHFIPQKYDSLRNVPAYSRFIKERFLRCLDLYLCPRAIKMKLNIDPESLVPKLPSPRDLQPFPTLLAIEYKGHTDMVRTISTDKSGQYLLSGSDDHTVKIWEVNTGRCLKTIQTDSEVTCVEWCPNAALSFILVASGKDVYIINPGVGDFVTCSKTDAILMTAPTSDAIVSQRIKSTVQWCEPEDTLYQKGIRLHLKHFKNVSQVTWHGRGDYFGTVIPEGQNRSVIISQLSKRKSQLPFTKSKGIIQCIQFHPTKPFLFVATQQHVRIYDLLKQTQIKKLLTNSKCISSMAIHTGGDNLLVGTYDRKMLWFDLDFSTKPYQTLRLHGTAVRAVAYHKRYPLFASVSDDCNLIISHGMVYNDLLHNAMIVPLKRHKDHKPFNDFGVLGVHFHPWQPWVFSSGADSTIKLYSN